MPRPKAEDDVGKSATIQVHPAVKRVLALEKAESNTYIGVLVANLVIEKYGNEPRYRKILKEAGLIE